MLDKHLESDGGGIEYRVWQAGTTTTVEHSATPILIPARSDSETLFRKVDSYSLGNAVLSDFDEIPTTGSGNNAIGGAAGG